MTGRLDGKSALVIGAARGIGEAITERFVEEGARVTIADTLRHDTRSSALTVERAECTANQAAVSSNARVCPAPCRAHGTNATTTPCSAQRTRGASASITARTVPRSNDRQRRRPRPGS